MASIHPTITGRKVSDDLQPLAVTVARACELTGFGPTSMWAFLKDGRLKPVRVSGVRRTLIAYDSLRRLLSSPSETVPSPSTERATPRPPRGRRYWPESVLEKLERNRVGKKRRTAVAVESAPPDT